MIGPESTGKTTLCRAMAEHFQTQWVPEYSRDFVENIQRTYTLADIEYCTKKQLEAEDNILQISNQFIFCDTELIIAKVWCEDIFDFCPAWIEKAITDKEYDLYLLTSPDLPFVHDPVRENADRRNYFFTLYKQELEKRSFSFSIIQGAGNRRFENALKTISGKFPFK